MPGTAASTVRDVFDDYLAAASSGQIERAPRTIITTRSAANTMSSTRLLDGGEFGRTALSKLSWQTIEELYGQMKSAELGVDWIRRCATVLSRALDFARKRGLIDSNPAKDATRPKSTRSKPFAPTVDEVRSLLAMVREQDEEFADAVSVLAGTGMRKAELLGLQWADVDLARDEIHVAAAITDAGPGQGVIRKDSKQSRRSEGERFQNATDADTQNTANTGDNEDHRIDRPPNGIANGLAGPRRHLPRSEKIPLPALAIEPLSLDVASEQRDYSDRTGSFARRLVPPVARPDVRIVSLPALARFGCRGSKSASDRLSGVPNIPGVLGPSGIGLPRARLWMSRIERGRCPAFERL